MRKPRTFTFIEQFSAHNSDSQFPISDLHVNSKITNRQSAIGNAFTLIELLVVIAIISILASLLLPALRQARLSSKKTVCISGMRQLGLGFLNYSGDFNMWMPLYGFQGRPAFAAAAGGGCNEFPGMSVGVGNLLYRNGLNYVPNYELFFCPDSQNVIRPRDGDRWYFWGWWECQHNDGAGFSGYLQFNGTLPATPGFNSDLFPMENTESGKKVLLACNNKWWNGYGWPTTSEMEGYPFSYPHNPHVRGTNFLYLDGHVGSFNYAGKTGDGFVMGYQNDGSYSAIYHEP